MAYWVRMGSSGSETIIQKLRDCQDLMGHCFHFVPRIFLIFSPLARVWIMTYFFLLVRGSELCLLLSKETLLSWVFSDGLFKTWDLRSSVIGSEIRFLKMLGLLGSFFESVSSPSLENMFFFSLLSNSLKWNLDWLTPT